MKRSAEEWLKEFDEIDGSIDPPSAEDVQAFAERVAARARREALTEAAETAFNARTAEEARNDILSLRGAEGSGEGEKT